MTKHYAPRDLEALDRAGNHYCNHVRAMTAEALHSKSDIAAELAWRDAEIVEQRGRADAAEARVRALRTVLKAWLAHTDPTTRWPCHECGRGGPGEELRLLETLTEDGRRSFHGCHVCNSEAHRQMARDVLKGGGDV